MNSKKLFQSKLNPSIDSPRGSQFAPRFAPRGFRNRREAAERLAQALSAYRGQNPLILGIPRGSVPMAKIIADILNGELDVVLVHKIGAPNNPEFGVGSVSEFGDIYGPEDLGPYEIPIPYLSTAAHEEIIKLQEKRASYSPIRPPISPKNRVVIIVDDGIATGSTALAAIRAIHAQRPKKLILATPIAPPKAIERLQAEVDELIVLQSPLDFFSISQFYDDFPQVSDDEVLKTLAESKKDKAA